jgi:hypothetical protein
MDRNLMAKLVFLITLPLAAAAANGLHFLSSAREVRRPFLFPPLTTLSAYLRLHGLLVLILICAVASRVWDGLQSTIHFLSVAWFTHVNVCAIARRRRNKKTTISPCGNIITNN